MIIECVGCQALVDANVVASYEYFDPEDGPPVQQYSFLKCPNCECPSLAIQEDYGNGWDTPYRLYPAQENQLNVSIPEPIRNAYAEARSCFKTKAYTAAAIMCRKTLEAICAEHGAIGRTLVSALKEMKEKGVIESRLYEWADALRISGNEAAHDVTITVLAEDARDVLEFTNALLEYVFTFRDKFEAFKQRRAKSSAPNQALKPTPPTGGAA